MKNSKKYSRLLSEFETMEGITSNIFDEKDWSRFDRFVESRKKEFQTAEEETLQKIKSVLPNESQAIRLIEQYGEWIRESAQKTLKTEEKYTKEDLFKATLEAVNIGMTLRQDQLNGWSDKSGNEVHKEWFNNYDI